MTLIKSLDRPMPNILPTTVPASGRFRSPKMKSRPAALGILRVCVYALLVAITATLLTPAPGLADWVKDAKEAAIKYADDKKDEFVKDQAKAAILALYKKLYRSSADLALSRTLTSVAISAPELNKLMNDVGEAYASGDPEKQREASQKVAVSFGQQLSKLASNSKTRQQLGAIIGSADKVKEVSAVLGNVAAGTDEGRRAAAQYVGQVLINLTPGAGIVGFYQSAYGAMKYANNAYVDSKIEDLYTDYKNGKLSRDGLIAQLESGTAGYHYVIENRRKELEREKIAAIGDAAGAASERVREHLTKTTQEEIIANILASFDGRIAKEKKDAAGKAARDKALKEAQTILTELDWAAKGREGSDWYKKTPVNLDKFTSIVRDKLKADGVLDPNNPLHVKLMSKAASVAMIHGKNSKEYAKVLDELKDARDRTIEVNKGPPCPNGSPTQALASRLWQKGGQLVAHKKVAAALPLLKQSLEFCPDEARAAQLAELTKLSEPAPQEFDGSYAGKATFTTGDWKTRRAVTASLTLRVENSVVTGTMTSREPQSEGRADIVRNADISGHLSVDGRLTATMQGKSALEKYRETEKNILTKEGMDAVGDIIIGGLVMTYSFEGSFTGEISDGRGAGNFSATRLGETPRPNHVVGSWKASRK